MEPKSWQQTSVAKIGLREDGIIYVRIEPGQDQPVAAAQENVSVCKQLSNGNRRPLLVDLRGAMVLTPETRLVYADPDLAHHFCKLAMVISQDPISRMMINLYLRTAQIGLPMKVFSTVPKAADWLLEK
ncbi:MAG: hypothetical protein AB7F86_19955 [Bdellovibrionales bacterium]